MYNFSINRILKKTLFLLFISFYFILHDYSIAYAIQQEKEMVEMQSDGKLQSILDEENDIPSLSSNTEDRDDNWRQHWFVKNILVEFPIIGDIFYDDESILITIKRMSKSTSMLLGGSIGMMLGFIPISENDNMTIKMSKDVSNMAIGMWAGTSIYNTIISLSSMIYNYIKNE